MGDVLCSLRAAMAWYGRSRDSQGIGTSESFRALNETVMECICPPKFGHPVT